MIDEVDRRVDNKKNVPGSDNELSEIYQIHMKLILLYRINTFLAASF